jgi:probable rRNA maturation factor
VDPGSSGVRDAGREARLRISLTDGRGRAISVPGLALWLARVAPASARGEIAIALVADARIRLLNRTYRRKDSATDVLSFPSAPSRLAPRAWRLAPRTPPSALRVPHLGDIVIATGVARRQAREACHPYATELKVLALHGLLHLLGYDHHAPSDRGRMARVERRLRAKGGLRSGLIERAGNRK